MKLQLRLSVLPRQYTTFASGASSHAAQQSAKLDFNAERSLFSLVARIIVAGIGKWRKWATQVVQIVLESKSGTSKLGPPVATTNNPGLQTSGPQRAMLQSKHMEQVKRGR